MKLREISVGYTFDQPWVDALARPVERRRARRRPQPRRRGRSTPVSIPRRTSAARPSRVGGADYFNLPLTRSFVFTVGLNR